MNRVVSFRLKLFHFSDEPDIAVFHPRAPSRHPESEPLVYAIEEAFQSLYLFPRECPRIGLHTPAGVRELYLDRSWESRWRTGLVTRYTMPAGTFECCHDHGVWASRTTIVPSHVETISDLPQALRETGVEVHVVPSLTEVAQYLYDFNAKVFHVEGVSMIRMSNLPNWPGSKGSPVRPQSARHSAS